MVSGVTSFFGGGEDGYKGSLFPINASLSKMHFSCFIFFLQNSLAAAALLIFKIYPADFPVKIIPGNSEILVNT